MFRFPLEAASGTIPFLYRSILDELEREIDQELAGQ
jgi:hypothetical protein